MKYKYFRDIVFLSLFVLQVTLHLQPQEYALKTAFIERFTRFTDWPESIITEDTTQSFVISVLGDNSFEDKLDIFSNSKKIKQRKVEVRYINKISEIEGSHILFISESEEVNLSSILKYIENRPILTIGDTQGFAEQGVIINFYLEDDQVRFEINNEALNKTDLAINYLLLNYAKLVSTKGGI